MYSGLKGLLSLNALNSVYEESTANLKRISFGIAFV